VLDPDLHLTHILESLDPDSNCFKSLDPNPHIDPDHESFSLFSCRKDLFFEKNKALVLDLKIFQTLDPDQKRWLQQMLFYSLL